MTVPSDARGKAGKSWIVPLISFICDIQGIDASLFEQTQLGNAILVNGRWLMLAC